MVLASMFQQPFRQYRLLLSWLGFMPREDNKEASERVATVATMHREDLEIGNLLG